MFGDMAQINQWFMCYLCVYLSVNEQIYHEDYSSREEPHQIEL